MRRILALLIVILFLWVPATLASEIEFQEGLSSFFGFMPAEFDFEHAKEAGGYWDRPFFELFEWGMIESKEGWFDFRMTDEYVRRAQRYGFHTLANIQPFAHWDQDLCHSNLPGIKSPRGRQTKGKPCNIDAYKSFVIRLVERYDGDGRDDMPGLRGIL